MKKNPVCPSERREKAAKWLADVLLLILGSALYAAGINCFTAPADIAPGGVGGLATVVSDLFGGAVSIGVIIGIFNIPLILAGFLRLGKALMLRTLIAVAAATLLTGGLSALFPAYTGDRMIAAVFGGVLIGAGLGVVYRRGGTTGGTDIVNKLIRQVKPHFSLGTIMMATDAFVVAVSMLVYGNLESGLYAIIAIFVSARVMDVILYGGREGKAILIFSEKAGEIGCAIVGKISRGATFLKGTGVYSGADRDVIFCAVQKNEYVKLKRLVREIDGDAFIVSVTSDEILGRGFRRNVPES